MKALLTVLAMLALAGMGRAVFPKAAQADPYPGKWGQVCCGPQCTGGDYCLGNGEYDCCK